MGNLPLAAFYLLAVKKQTSPLSDTRFSQAVSMESLSVSTSSFTLDLYKELNETSRGQNIFFSPWSIATALAMVYLGAKGDTATQMAEVSSEISSTSLYLWFPHKVHYSFAYGEQKGTAWENGDLPLCLVQETMPLTMPAVLQVTVLPLYFQVQPALHYSYI